MPTLDSPEAESPIKMLILGNSGTGKTGSLASLAQAGYTLHIADFDNGTAILRNILKKDKPSLARIEVEKFADRYKAVGARVIPSEVKAWANAMATLTKWTNQYQSMDHIIVVDSLNFATKAAFNWVLQLASRLQVPKEIQDWLAAQDLVESFLLKLYSDEVKCHIIMTSHIQYLGQGENDIKVGYPMTALGQKFAPKIPRFFNSCILCRSSGTGVALKREIWTSPVDYVDLKTESLSVKRSYPIGDLAGFFQSVRGVSPGQQTAAA